MRQRPAGRPPTTSTGSLSRNARIITERPSMPTLFRHRSTMSPGTGCVAIPEISWKEMDQRSAWFCSSTAAILQRVVPNRSCRVTSFPLSTGCRAATTGHVSLPTWSAATSTSTLGWASAAGVPFAEPSPMPLTSAPSGWPEATPTCMSGACCPPFAAPPIGSCTVCTRLLRSPVRYTSGTALTLSGDASTTWRKVALTCWTWLPLARKSVPSRPGSKRGAPAGAAPAASSLVETSMSGAPSEYRHAGFPAASKPCKPPSRVVMTSPALP
mmetsp:Transcript_85670/g.266350  ORF Transcript_85670/g.266350 Transcript_85670/m.266350 type:complete len:270 (-) Transcript_85670:17-826(-)